MEEKPAKQLVTGGKYIRVMGTKLSLYSFAGGISCVGLVGLLFTVIAMVATVRSVSDLFLWLIPAPLLGGLSIVLIYFGRSMFQEGKEIEPVEILSERNANRLPLKETLVRSSSPPSLPQDELLRPTKSASETPQEQLLRPHSSGE